MAVYLKNKFLITSIVVIFVVAIIGGLVLLKDNKTKSLDIRGGVTIPTGTPIPSGESEGRVISISEIAKHNTSESCWTTINGGVYDVTKFIPNHKGGQRILNACGIDATDLFTGKSPLGRLHSQMAVKILSGMKIGTLQK